MPDGEDLLGRIESVALPVLGSHGLFLVDIEYRREGRRWVLRFFVDKSGGVSIADCQRFSHEMGDVLEVSGVLPGPYDLEVSSPGLDRELRKDREFVWAIGRPVRCWVREPIEGRTEFAGRLVDATASELRLAGADETTTALPRRLVARARLELLPRGGGRAGRRDKRIRDTQ
ncbi:MAG: ribosome maturation factor RimP [Candidatus Rokubacteria bacterium]|nr:ribosome maturation factor RimP [Candidatus Rokubacteria bacterium]